MSPPLTPQSVPFAAPRGFKRSGTSPTKFPYLRSCIPPWLLGTLRRAPETVHSAALPHWQASDRTAEFQLAAGFTFPSRSAHAACFLRLCLIRSSTAKKAAMTSADSCPPIAWRCRDAWPLDRSPEIRCLSFLRREADLPPATVRLGALPCTADLPAGRPTVPLSVCVFRLCCNYP